MKQAAIFVMNLVNWFIQNWLIQDQNKWPSL